MENQNENLNKGKGTVIVIIFLVLLVLGLGGYIVYDKMLTKESIETKEPAKTEKVEEPKEDLNAIANILFEKEEKYKLYEFGSKYENNMDNLTITNQLNNVQLHTLSIYFLSNNLTVTKSNIDNYVKDLYNIKLTSYPEIPLCGAKFDTSKNEYVINPIAHDAMENKPLISKVANIEKNGDNYVLTVTRVYEPAMGLIETPEQEYYADGQFTIKINELHQFTNKSEIGEVLKTDKEKAKQYYEQNYEKFKSLKPQYKYTFAKTDNNYYLVSYEAIK